MTNTIVSVIAAVGEIGWALAQAMFLLAFAVVALFVWVGLGWAAHKAFKNFRLYSRHPLAVRIRRFVRLRRQMKAARA